MDRSASSEEPDTGGKGLKKVPQVAAFLAVSRSKVYQLMEAGDLPYVKLGKSRRIPWESVLRLVDENLVGDRPKLTRFAKSERERIEAEYDRRESQLGASKTHEVPPNAPKDALGAPKDARSAPKDAQSAPVGAQPEPEPEPEEGAALSANADALPSELLAWIAWFNDCKSRGLVARGVDRAQPNRGVIQGWKRRERNGELRQLISSENKPKFEAEFKASKFLKEPWFGMEKLFTKNDDGDYIAKMILDGRYQDAAKPRQQPSRDNTGSREPGRGRL